MKQNRTNVLIILLFIAIITLPQITFWFINNDTSEISESENRKLNSKPELKFETITEYPKQFDDYYSDHLPFRTMFRNTWAKLNYNIFNVTVDDRVLLGKDNWLFYRGDKSIEQVQGLAIYTETEKNDILTKLRNNVTKLQEMGIETYVLVLPNKENIYKDYLPSNILIKDNISRTEELINYIRNNSNIKVIYPKLELLEVKKDYQVYRKYDTHWNKIGAFVGTQALQKAIDNEFSYDLDNILIERKQEKDGGDLAAFANLEEELFENLVRVKNFYPEIEYKKSENMKCESYEEFTSNSENDKTVVFIGDSFRNDMIEYFSKLYKKVIYIHRDYYKKGIIEEIKPDIVVIEAVERLSEGLMKELF